MLHFSLVEHNMSTTARHAIKPKVLTLLELCQSVTDFRQFPPSSTASYNYQVQSNTAQILTRRLYLHPLTINPNAKQQLAKLPSSTANSPDNEQRHQSNVEKVRDKHRRKKKSSHDDLTILSTSLPLLTRTNPKSDIRPSREKISMQIDEDINSDFELSATNISLNQPSFNSFTRRKFPKPRSVDSHPPVIGNQQKIYRKTEKMNVWHQLDRTLHRPTPLDPPTTPLGSEASFKFDNDQEENQYSNYQSIQELHIYKRNRLETSFTDDGHDYDHVIYDE